MPGPQIVSSNYKKLIAGIVCRYEGVRRSLVVAGWMTGRDIVLVDQKGEARAVRGEMLLQKISGDLTRRLGPGFSVQSLRRMRQFYLENPKRSPASVITWAHHIELLSIRDKKVRAAFEKRAEQDELDRDSLRALVRHEKMREQVAANFVARDSGLGTRQTDKELRGASPEEQVPLLTPTRGTLYTYRILRPKFLGTGKSELLIDLGFSCTKDLDNVTGKTFAPETIVESVKTSDGTYRLSESRAASPESLFTYLAEIEKVVDGDTLKAVVDLGFGIKTRQSLRLRGLDCPEMDTEEGKEAADFVRARIRAASRILLTSCRSDKYDRYLADVFYIDAQGKEVYLNNALLEHGYAVRVRG